MSRGCIHAVTMPVAGLWCVRCGAVYEGPAGRWLVPRQPPPSALPPLPGVRYVCSICGARWPAERHGCSLDRDHDLEEISHD